MERHRASDVLRRCAIAALVGLLHHAVPAGASASAADWPSFTHRFVEDSFEARPHFAVWAGRHEFDGRLPDLSAAGIRREIARLHAARRQALAFRNGMLNGRQRFERDYLVAAIDADLFWLETVADPFRNPDFYSWSLDPDVYIAREYAPLAVRMRAYVAYAKNIPHAAAQIQANLRTPLPKSFVRIGHIRAGGLASFYESDVPAVFATVDDAALQAEFRAANAGAVKAMRELDAWFTRQEASATDAFALGSAKFTAMLRASERIDVPLARLGALAQRDLERNLDALRAACAEMLPDAPVAACVAKVKADKVTGKTLAVATAQLDELQAFVRQKALVTIPGTERAHVAESPAYERFNIAHIRIPGPLERNVPSIYYVAPPDPKWTKDEQDAYIPDRAELLFISAHEVWPGHFVQFQHANRSTSIVGRLFGTYSFN